MTPDQPSDLSLRLVQISASRYRLLLLTNWSSARTDLQRVCQVLPACEALNLNLVLSVRLLELPSQQRPAQAPIMLDDLLKGEPLLWIYNIELLFDPILQLEPLRALKAASRSRTLLVLWPGASENDGLTYAKPGHPEYKRYGPPDLMDILVVPVAELTLEA